ncbi:NACHT, LRR and PYD domains-containing protein 12-like [Gastrophryne carolinensis]
MPSSASNVYTIPSIASDFNHSLSLSLLATHRDHIVFTLEDLDEYDFKKFNDRLSEFSYGDNIRIPRGCLENADPVTTKNLLVDTFGDEGAPEVTIKVLKLLGLMKPASDLQEKIGEHELKKKCKISAIKKFKRIGEHNSRNGEAVSLQKKYNTLLMRVGYPDKEDKEHEIVHKGRKHAQASEQRYSADYYPTTLQELFDPDKHGDTPDVAVLYGPAGIGKTWTSRKIILDWASGNLYQDRFDFVFYLSCRELNNIKGKISILHLLTRVSCLSSEDLKYILKDSGNYERILFVIDGFDEFKWTLKEEEEEEEEEEEAGPGLYEEIHKEALLKSLLRKGVLDQSILLITTRSLAQKKLNTLIKDPRYIEIKGFSDKDCRKYIHDSFENKADAEKALGVIEDNSILFFMCTFPILCWIICTVLRQGMKKGLDLFQYKTTTSIYLLYLKGLILYHSRTKSIHACLKKLCALANDGVLSQKNLFEEEDLNKHGLSLSEVDSVFLNENIFHVDIETQNCYSFIHLSVQEFLAAFHYVLDDGDGGAEEAPLPEICKEGSLPELHKKHPHLSLAVSFLFGLLYEKQLNDFSMRVGFKVSLRYRSAVEEWLTGHRAKFTLAKWIVGDISFSSIDVISCLYETQNEDLVRRALFHSSCLNLDRIWHHVRKNKNDLKQLYYCLKQCRCPFTLSVQREEIHSEEQETLFSFLHMCQKLKFFNCLFLSRSTREYGRTVAMKLFGVKGNVATDPVGLSWLSNSESKIQELCLRQCDLSAPCCDVFSSALVTNPSLTKLDLSWNLLGDSAVTRLCKGLRDPRCPLQELSLYMCDLSPLCCDDLGPALATNRSLTKLDLSKNHLQDSGIKNLCEGLRDPCCTLKELSFRGCYLSHLGCNDLQSVLVKNQSLMKLDLSENELKDCGIKRLREGLNDPDCTLQELSLRRCELSSLCCDDLCSVLVENQSLTKLDLSDNNLGDSGVKSLCKGLGDSHCTLQELSLAKCNLSPSCCDDFRSVFVANQYFTKLDLTRNCLKDSGVMRLCEWLKDHSCTLQELSLLTCNLSPLCCEVLHAVLITNRSLTKLDLSYNRLEDSGVKRLCEGLRDLDCSLQELRFFHCGATPSCFEDLRSVVDTNYSLTLLETSLDIDEKMSDAERSSLYEGLQSLGFILETR